MKRLLTFLAMTLFIATTSFSAAPTVQEYDSELFWLTRAGLSKEKAQNVINDLKNSASIPATEQLINAYYSYQTYAGRAEDIQETLTKINPEINLETPCLKNLILILQKNATILWYQEYAPYWLKKALYSKAESQLILQQVSQGSLEAAQILVRAYYSYQRSFSQKEEIFGCISYYAPHFPLHSLENFVKPLQKEANARLRTNAAIFITTLIFPPLGLLLALGQSQT